MKGEFRIQEAEGVILPEVKGMVQDFFQRPDRYIFTKENPAGFSFLFIGGVRNCYIFAFFLYICTLGQRI